MKLVYVYSKHDSNQKNLINRVELELGQIVTVIESEEAISRGYHIFKTPCMFPMCDNWSGEELLQDDIDGKLILTTTAYKLMDMEEREFHNVDNARLDVFVVGESNNAVDETVMEMISEGIII